MMALGASACPMLQAESAEMGTLQQSPRDGRRIVPAEIASAGGGRYLCRDDATAIPRALLERAHLGRLRMQHWGGRSAQRHHGVDGVPTPERTVDPAAI